MKDTLNIILLNKIKMIKIYLQKKTKKFVFFSYKREPRKYPFAIFMNVIPFSFILIQNQKNLS